MKILVAEDDEDLRILIGRWCSFKKVDAVIVSDPDEALEVYDQSFDFVLSDVDMKSEIDGFGLLKKIRGINQDQKFYIMSGADYKKRAIEEGANDFLLKPFGRIDFNNFLDKIYSSINEVGAAPY